MSDYRHSRVSSLRIMILSCLVFLFTVTSVHAKPKLGYVQLVGGSPGSHHSKSWVNLKAKLSNPDKKSIQVEIKVRPSFISYVDFNVFSEEVIIPASSDFIYSTPIYLDQKNEFTVEMFSGGIKISSQKVKIKSSSKQTSHSLVVNDSETDTFYQTKKLPEFKELVLTPTVSSSMVPDSWLALKDLTSIILVNPDYAKFSTAHYEAIITYVQQGGTIIFANPTGAINAAKTPLVSLLPIIPIRVTVVNELPLLNKIAPNSKNKLSANTPLLETYIKGDGITVLGNDKTPLIRWKRYGLGSCRFIAFPVNESTISDRNFATKVIQKLIPFKKSKRITKTSYTKIQEFLDSMTGIKIPSIGLIQAIFAGYFLVLVATASICIYLKRPGLLWIATSAVAVLFAITLVYKSSSSGLSGATIVSEFKSTIAGPDGSTTNSLFSAYSGNETNLDIAARATQASFTSFPNLPMVNTARSLHQKKKARIAKSFLISRRTGLSTLSKQKLRPNTPLQFQLLSSTSQVGITDYPELILTENSYELQPWAVPTEIKGMEGFLVLPSKIIPLSLKGGQVSLSKTSIPSMNKQLIAELIGNYRHVAPFIGLLSQAINTDLQVSENTNYTGKKFHLIPVQLSIGTPQITINSDLLSLSYTSATVEQIIRPGTTSTPLKTKGQGRHKLEVILPTALSQLQLEQIRIEIDYTTGDKNFEVNPILHKGKKNIWGWQKEPGLFLFDQKHINRAYNKATSSFGITIFEKLKSKKRNKIKKKKSLTWTPKSFSLSIKGRLPDGMAPLKY